MPVNSLDKVWDSLWVCFHINEPKKKERLELIFLGICLFVQIQNDQLFP